MHRQMDGQDETNIHPPPQQLGLIMLIWDIIHKQTYT